LLGLTVGISLCLPNFLPKRYANISVDHAPKNINQIKYCPLGTFLVKTKNEKRKLKRMKKANLSGRKGSEKLSQKKPLLHLFLFIKQV